MEAVIGNQSGKIQDITECDILQITLSLTGNSKKLPEIYFAKGLTFKIPEGNLETLWGMPADGGKKENSAYHLTQYLYEDQNRYTKATVDATDGVTKVELGILTEQMGGTGAGESTEDKEAEAEAENENTDADSTTADSTTAGSEQNAEPADTAEADSVRYCNEEGRDRKV